MGLDATFHSESQPQQNASQSALWRSQPWYQAYMAALFESDRGQIEDRIRTAKQLILARERELLAARAELPEQRALNNALHALHALHACLFSKKLAAIPVPTAAVSQQTSRGL